MTLDPPITITLPQSAWVSLISIVGRQPFTEVVALITAIVAQADPQIEAAKAKAPATDSASATDTQRIQ